MIKLLSAFAPAKINLYLRVTGRRDDGFHELDSIFVPITLGDLLRLEIRPDTGVRVVETECGKLPSDTNLATLAARAFLEHFDIGADVRIKIMKRIPLGAGLGGGSSDAGTVLRMLASLYGVGDHKSLREIALRLGADVPFFVEPRVARVNGVGEQIEALAHFPDLSFVIAVPPIEISTGTIFRALQREHWSGRASDADLRLIMEGRLHPGLLVNDLAKISAVRFPEIAQLIGAMEHCGALGAAMSGSGSAAFGVFRTYAQAVEAAAIMHNLNPGVNIAPVSIYRDSN
jgi:4-diphosphocytidyl-2-C-methyl-D-erythritol kinase